MKLIDIVVEEFFAVVERLQKKIPVINGRMIVDSKVFYALLEAKLYIKRNEKLEIYKTLNFIVCNSNGLTSVVYDKETKKTSRKIIINYDAYEVMKKIYNTEFDFEIVR